MGVRTLELRFDAEPGERVDRVVARALEAASRPCGRRAARRLVEHADVRIDGRRVTRSSTPVAAGAHVLIVRADEKLIPELEDAVERFSLAVDAILELTPDRIVVDKPAGLPTDPTRDPRRDNVIDAVARYLRAIGERDDGLRAVHRLDRDTSGVLLIARTRAAAAELGAAFRDRSASKTYLALCVHGEANVAWPVGQERFVDAPIGEIPGPGRTSYGVVVSGKQARTRVIRVAGNQGASLFRAHPETGRTHQVRIHLAHAGFPIAGDATYGAPASDATRVMLHAAELRLRELEWATDPPDDFQDLQLRIGLSA